jgi:hypothetical protein
MVRLRIGGRSKPFRSETKIPVFVYKTYSIINPLHSVQMRAALKNILSDIDFNRSPRFCDPGEIGGLV